MIEIMPATFRHALYLADRLRYEDAREIAAGWGVGARQGLFHCLLNSDRQFALLDDGRPVALWGASSRIESDLRIGLPWLLAAQRLFDGPRQTLLRSRHVIDHLLCEHDVLTNVTDAGNRAHLRWLSWCGFSVLRRHARYGAAGRPFVEFYRVNPRRGLADAAVRAVLLRRPVTNRVPDDPVVGRLVELAIELLVQPGGFDSRRARVLCDVLERLAQPDGTASPPRRGCVRLLLELAGVLGGVSALPGAPRSAPLGELISALSAAADLGALAQVPVDRALLELGRPGQPAASPAPDPAVRAAQPPVRPVGFDLAALLRRHLRLLTVDGRFTRTAGYRFWCAALGVEQGRADRPLGLARPELDALFAEQGLQRALFGDGRAPDPPVGTLLARAVEHGTAVAAMRGAVPAGHPLHAPLGAELDALVPSDGSADEGRIAAVRDLLYAASAVADRVALRMLPSLRLGGVVTGYADRHWLYRLLRVRLTQAGAALPDGALGGLLAQELAALLAAARVEDRLLAADGPLTDAELQRARAEALAVRGGERLEDPALAGWLAAPLIVPARHRLELGPALFAWHSHVRGSVPEHLDALGDVLGAGPLVPRQRYRNVLRRLTNGLAIVTLANHLGLDLDAEPGSVDNPSRLGRR